MKYLNKKGSKTNISGQNFYFLRRVNFDRGIVREKWTLEQKTKNVYKKLLPFEALDRGKTGQRKLDFGTMRVELTFL
jgi:hypothetical protein